VPEVEQLMRESIQFHVEATREDGDPVPPPTTVATAVVEVGPAA
jgi:predicted RNase H-like HicB family nuclease